MDSVREASVVASTLDKLGRMEAAQRRMLELVPFAAARNPIDVNGQFLNEPSLLDQFIELAATNGDYGSLVSFQGSIGRNPALMEATLASWIARKRANPDMHFAVSGFCTPEYTRDLEAAGIPVYEEATHATRAVVPRAAPAPGRPGARRFPGRPTHDGARDIEACQQLALGGEQRVA